MVHNWARERLESQLKQKKTEEAVILCGRIFMNLNDKRQHDWAFERRIWPHIASVQTSWAAPSNTLADGEILFQAASDMGGICAQHGRYSDAECQLQWALDGQEKILGKYHPFTLNTVNNMAVLFDKQGQNEKALEWYGRALDGKEKILGKDHPFTLNTVHNMAGVFYNQGQYEKALEWYGRALDGYEKTFEKDHLSTLHTVNNMAAVFDSQGQYEKALEWYGRALDGYEKTLGKDHPQTINTVHNMAAVFKNQGQYEKALEWYGRALDGCEKFLGKDHPSTLQTLRSFNDAQSQLRGTNPSGP
jgi:tetratricopeptide (TPR) repeat protein